MSTSDVVIISPQIRLSANHCGGQGISNLLHAMWQQNYDTKKKCSRSFSQAQSDWFGSNSGHQPTITATNLLAPETTVFQGLVYFEGVLEMVPHWRHQLILLVLW
jgi:hypothetical protein|mmetsp:Transcript_26639/g.45260  ORF Transcript_26639/g.45260 Transcript_26639/m.45260 type:complete len:105 (-) Transcript_26639:1314-1628(-)